jgi:hypothetical protein
VALGHEQTAAYATSPACKSPLFSQDCNLLVQIRQRHLHGRLWLRRPQGEIRQSLGEASLNRGSEER